jgi:hypothetical protein
MKNKENSRLWWYGVIAKAKELFGRALIIIGIVVGIGLILISHFWIGIIAFLIGLIVGIYLIIEGKKQYFDFERTSGHILYRGAQ